MQKHWVFFVATIMVATGASAQEDRTRVGELVVGEFYSIRSEVLDEDQVYTVSLPFSYARGDTSKTYPVVYVLDGYNTQLLSVASLMRALSMFGAKVPEAIIIGIPSNNRTRDYTPVHYTHSREGDYVRRFEATGGAEAYRKFLKEELIPHVDKHYRTKQHRILVGHSFGGLFALNDMLSEEPSFTDYVAIDPVFWTGGWFLENKVQEMPAGRFGLTGNLYISTVPHDDGGLDQASADTFVATLRAKASPMFKVTSERFEKENHQSVQSVSYYEGLRFVFADFEGPSWKQAAENPALITEHYERYSERVGVTYVPDRSYVRTVAFNALFEFGLPEHAHELFQLNVKNYPQSSDVWTDFGDYYAEVGEPDEARAAFQHALQLNETNGYAARRLSDLETEQE